MAQNKLFCYCAGEHHCDSSGSPKNSNALADKFLKQFYQNLNKKDQNSWALSPKHENLPNLTSKNVIQCDSYKDICFLRRVYSIRTQQHLFEAGCIHAHDDEILPQCKMHETLDSLISLHHLQVNDSFYDIYGDSKFLAATSCCPSYVEKLSGVYGQNFCNFESQFFDKNKRKLEDLLLDFDKQYPNILNFQETTFLEDSSSFENSKNLGTPEISKFVSLMGGILVLVAVIAASLLYLHHRKIQKLVKNSNSDSYQLDKLIETSVSDSGSGRRVLNSPNLSQNIFSSTRANTPNFKNSHELTSSQKSSNFMVKVRSKMSPIPKLNTTLSTSLFTNTTQNSGGPKSVTSSNKLLVSGKNLISKSPSPHVLNANWPENSGREENLESISRQLKNIQKITKFGYFADWNQEQVFVREHENLCSWARISDVYKNVNLKSESVLNFIAGDLVDTSDIFQCKFLEISEFHELGNLKNLLERSKAEQLDTEIWRKLMQSIIDAVKFLHISIPGSVSGKIPLAHNNLAPKNILISKNLTGIISDFSLAVYNVRNVPSTQEFSSLWHSKYASPELSQVVLAGGDLSHWPLANFLWSDLFSLGLILLEIYQSQIDSSLTLLDLTSLVDFSELRDPMLIQIFHLVQTNLLPQPQPPLRKKL